VIAGDLAYVAVVGAVLATTDLFDGAVVVWAVLFAAQTPMLVALILAGYMVENSDAPSTRITGLAAAVGLLAATACGLVAVPLAGGVGALVAFAVARIVQAGMLRSRLPRRAGPLSTPVKEDSHAPA
jgi:hypothetical protein